jgi:hypothetical protein
MMRSKPESAVLSAPGLESRLVASLAGFLPALVYGYARHTQGAKVA